VVKAGDVVRVKVMEVDAPRKRIGLSMRLSDKAGEQAEKRGGSQRRGSNDANQRSPKPRQEQPAKNNAFAAAFANAKQRS
jgi:uncharacterized protein